MKKGKLLVGILIGIAGTLFVSKNKWCQEKIVQPVEGKVKDFVDKCKTKCQEEEPATEEVK